MHVLGTLDRPTVLKRLADVDRTDRRRRVGGAMWHQYRLNPPVPLAVVEAFEVRHGVALPEDYRFFITAIGNGGAGPHCGMLPFGKDDDDCDWDSGRLVGDPSKPFAHSAAWNLPQSFWDELPDPPPGTSREEEDRLMEAWYQKRDAHYGNPAIMDGAIPIGNRGCGLLQWLVVSGQERGNVWDDLRADDAGIAPVRDEAGEPVTFARWYLEWLDNPPRMVIDPPWPVGFWRRIWRKLTT